MTKVEELRGKVLRYRVGDYVEHDIEDGYAVRDICVVGTDDLDSLISASHAEGVAGGAEQERERIRKTHLMGIGVVDGIDYVLVPASVLAPTKVNPERGKPSQALLDELSEICGGKVEYEPKEKP